MDFPTGTVILWTGTPETIPAGWIKYTPAEGRFIRGVPSGGEVGSSGGSATHDHTAGAVASAGALGHPSNSFAFNTVSESSYLLSGTPTVSVVGTHNHTADLTLGSGVGAHTHPLATARTGTANNLPPHKQAIYIVKI